MANSVRNSGYDAKNIVSLDEKFKCQVCGLILKNAAQLLCGHRICFSCISHKNKDVQCSKCLQITPTSKIHLEQSHHQHECSYCHETFNSVILLNEHKETTCPLMPVNCILAKNGCQEKILRGNLSNHYLSDIHQQILLLCILQFLASQSLADAHGDLSSNVTTMVIDQQDCIEETMDLFSSGIEDLNDDIQRLNNELLQQSQTIEATSKNLEMLKISCEESNADLNARIINMTVLQQEFDSLKETITERQSTSYDGTLIWRITDVKEKMLDAQSERRLSIYSSPFYSSLTGYKMCARLYMLGDGNARHTDMSLFFVLMRSNNDPLLSFPFKYKVTFCLYDQTDQQRHIIESFRPDVRSSSFQKPRCAMNIASGIPKFISLNIIQKDDNPYIKNDTMFIKIMVDFENLPRTILPYAMNLNPGIPMHCQQKMIHQELERQAQLQSQQISPADLMNNEATTHSRPTINNQLDKIIDK